MIVAPPALESDPPAAVTSDPAPPSEPATIVTAAPEAATSSTPVATTAIATTTDGDTALPDVPVSDRELRTALGVSSTAVVSTRPASASAAASASSGKRAGADEDLDDDRVADQLDGGRRRLRRFALLAAAVLLVLGVATFALLGRSNGQRFVLVCGTDRVTPMQGRSFPPWGESSLAGLQWKPVAIPPAAECRDREASSEQELSSWYLTLLVEQATARLTARKVTEIDLAAAQLGQALLLARAPDRRAERRDIDRLLGDVEYWRAVDKLRAASSALDAAAKQFEEAALKQPKHVTDAAARAAQLRRLLEELAGRISLPPGAPATPGLATESPVASPSNPSISTVPTIPATPTTFPAVDAGAPSSDAPVDAGPASLPPDAGSIPTDAAPALPDASSSGGVLL